MSIRNSKRARLTALQKRIRRARRRLEAGDPTDAVSVMDVALNLHAGSTARHFLLKARDEADMGSIQAAETLLEMAEASAKRCKANPRPKPPFKFQPNKRSIVDGVARERSNGDNARDAEEMLSLLPDRDQLDDATALGDALANLLHWCDREGINFDTALLVARFHHQAER